MTAELEITEKTVDVVRIEIAKLELGPRDVLVVRVPPDTDVESMTALYRMFQGLVANKIMLTYTGMEMDVVRPPLIATAH